MGLLHCILYRCAMNLLGKILAANELNSICAYIVQQIPAMGSLIIIKGNSEYGQLCSLQTVSQHKSVGLVWKLAVIWCWVCIQHANQVNSWSKGYSNDATHTPV